jgi:hypothetical protein
MHRLRSVALEPVLWGRVENAEAKERFKRTAWDWAVVTVARAYDESRGAIPVVQAVVSFAAGLPLGTELADARLGVQLLIGAACGFVIFWGIPTLFAAILSVRVAPRKQRDEARQRLAEADRQRRLLILGAHLERVREVLHQSIEQGTYRQLSGRVPDDTAPWIERENRDLRRRLERLGLPELIRELTVDDTPSELGKELSRPNTSYTLSGTPRSTTMSASLGLRSRRGWMRTKRREPQRLTPTAARSTDALANCASVCASVPPDA